MFGILNKVTVMAFPDGNVTKVHTWTDKETGEEKETVSIMLQQASLTSLNALGRVSRKVGFVSLDNESYEMIKELIYEGATFPAEGKLVIKETTTPYVSKSTGKTQEPQRRGENGEVITHKGEPIYRNVVFSQNLDEKDIILVPDELVKA